MTMYTTSEVKKKAQEKMLITLIAENDFGLDDAPRVTHLNGKWYQMTIGIGNDHTAYLRIDDEALKALCEREGMDYKSFVNKQNMLAQEKTEA